MRISVITPNFNGGRWLENCIRSVLAQQGGGVELEYIVVDGGSSDESLAIIARYRSKMADCIVEPDRGPAEAINKGLRRATGEIVGWLNADDRYHPGALRRVAAVADARPDRALYFGRCRIVNEADKEIRRGITRFKEAFFPVSCRFVLQCINYISQPAAFFRRVALEAAGPLREDLSAAFDYELLLRLWRHGGAARVPGPPLADFRWHEGSISGRQFDRQFAEEWRAAAADAGRWAPQTWIHYVVRQGIVWSYRRMARRRQRGSAA